MQRILCWVGLLSLLALPAACNQAEKGVEKAKEEVTEKIAEKSGKDLDVDIDKDKIKISSKEGEAEVGVDSGGSGKEKGLPGSDVVGGKDIKGVPRYPDSVKTEFISKKDAIMNGYVADAAIEEVSDFYKSRLRKKSWSLRGERQSGGGSQMFFIKDNQNLAVTIGPASSKYEGHTSIELVLQKK